MNNPELEILLLLSKYDLLLQKYVKNVIGKSQPLKNRHVVGKLHTGHPGSLVKFLSKTVTDYIIDALGFLMKKTIADDIRKSEFFNLQIDSTQDINVHCN